MKQILDCTLWALAAALFGIIMWNSWVEHRDHQALLKHTQALSERLERVESTLIWRTVK